MICQDQRGFRTNTPSEAFYFNSGDQKLFGWLHRPVGIARDLGLVICKPFGYEAICSHRSMRAFAEMTASIGVPTLRFDYLGTGDSAEIDPQANQLEVWTNDTVAAIDELKRVTGVERVCLLAVRLGAVVAIAAATRCRSVSGLALISPIVKGARYLREIRITALAASLNTGGKRSSERKDNGDQAASARSIEVSGYPLSAATMSALTQVDLTRVDLTRSGASAPEMLIIDGNSMPLAQSWAAGLSAAKARVRYMALPGLVEMVMAMPHDARPAQQMLVAVRDWLQVFPSRLQSERTSPYRLGAAPPEATALELPGDEPAREPGISERPVFLASDPKVFGILSTPRQDERRRRAVILVNGGATYHAGPNRCHVSLARLWARSGCVVIRMDLAGLGDSGTRAGRPDNEMYPPAALDDIRSAIDFVRNVYGIDKVTLCGFCSGAYHMLRAAAAQLPVNCLLMVNAEQFFWEEVTQIDELQPVEVVKRARGHREKIFSIAAWKRLLTGQINVWRMLRIYIR